MGNSTAEMEEKIDRKERSHSTNGRQYGSQQRQLQQQLQNNNNKGENNSIPFKQQHNNTQQREYILHKPNANIMHRPYILKLSTKTYTYHNHKQRTVRSHNDHSNIPHKSTSKFPKNHIHKTKISV